VNDVIVFQAQIFIQGFKVLFILYIVRKLKFVFLQAIEWHPLRTLPEPEPSDTDEVPTKAYLEIGVQTDQMIATADGRHKELMTALRSLQQRADRQAKSLITLQETVTSLRNELQEQKNPLHSIKGIIITKSKFFVVSLNKVTLMDSL